MTDTEKDDTSTTSEKNTPDEASSTTNEWTKRIADAKELAKKKIEEIRPILDTTTEKIKEKYKAARDSETAKNVERRLSAAGTYANDAYESVKAKSIATVKEASERVTEKTKGLRKKAAEQWDDASTRIEELRKRAREKYPQYFGKNQGQKSAEAFRQALNRGFEGVEIKAGQRFQLPFRVAGKENRELRWEFYLWDYDIEFKVLQRTMAIGGAVEVHVRNPSKCKCDAPIKGFYKSTEAGTIVLVWDNSASWMRSKHIAYRAYFADSDEDEGERESSEATPEKSTATKSGESKILDAHAHLSEDLKEAGSPTQLRKSLVEDEIKPLVLLPRNLPPPGGVASTSSSTPVKIPSTGVLEKIGKIQLDDTSTAADIPDPDDPKFWEKIGVDGEKATESSE
eukprot:g1962.t1